LIYFFLLWRTCGALGPLLDAAGEASLKRQISGAVVLYR
jgi:hypothetical protein